MPNIRDDGKSARNSEIARAPSRKRQTVPKVEQPDPASPQFQTEVREEIEKEKLDP